MGDLARIGIFLAVCLSVMGIILGFPIMLYMNLDVFRAGIDTIVNLLGEYFIFGRGLINNFLSPWARTAVTGLMEWFLCKNFLTFSLKISVWVYRWIFKG